MGDGRRRATVGDDDAFVSAPLMADGETFHAFISRVDLENT
jgi:hypothetical protein